MRTTLFLDYIYCVKRVLVIINMVKLVLSFPPLIASSSFVELPFSSVWDSLPLQSVWSILLELDSQLREIKEAILWSYYYLGVVQFQGKMYANTGLMSPCFQNLSQEVQQLDDFCKPQRPNASLVLFLLLFFAFTSGVFALKMSPFLSVYLECWSYRCFITISWFLTEVLPRTLVEHVSFD